MTLRTFPRWLLACLVLSTLLACGSRGFAQPLPPEPPPIENDPPAAAVENNQPAPSAEEPPAEPEQPVEPEQPAPAEESSGNANAEPEKLLQGELPWSEAAKPTKKLPAQRLQSARQMLELFGIDDSQWYRMEDGKSLTSSEEELLFKVLFRLPRFLLEDIERWQQHSADWSLVAADAEEHRGDMYLLKGTALSIQRIEMQPELATSYEFRYYYRVLVAHADQPDRHSVVYTRHVPSAWPIDTPLSERVRVSGIFLKSGPTDPESPTPLVFAAPRIGWFPETTSAELGVTEDRQKLASYGMDLGLLDTVTQRTGVGSRERECFYQMLAAMRHAPASGLTTEERPVSDIAPLFQAPEKQIGKLQTFVGTARRISKVECDPDIRRRLGLSHYYQIDVFIPLDDEQIRLGRKEDTAPDEEGPVFTSNFPFTLCVAKLPKGMKEAQEMNEQIRFNAYFFKLWTYKTVYMNQFGTERKQIGPMLIGRQFEVVQPAEWAMRPYLGTIFGVLFVVALAAIWFSVWRNSQADEEFQRTTLSKSYEVPGGGSLNEAGIEEAEEPDFSNWGEADTEEKVE